MAKRERINKSQAANIAATVSVHLNRYTINGPDVPRTDDPAEVTCSVCLWWLMHDRQKRDGIHNR